MFPEVNKPNPNERESKRSGQLIARAPWTISYQPLKAKVRHDEH